MMASLGPGQGRDVSHAQPSRSVLFAPRSCDVDNVILRRFVSHGHCRGYW